MELHGAGWRAVVEGGRPRMRRMASRECARLQGAAGFPPVGTVMRQMFALANAVCVPAIRWINRHVLPPVAAEIRGKWSGARPVAPLD